MRKIRLILVYGVLFVLIFTGAYTIIGKLFAIKQIEVVGTNMKLVINRDRLPATLLFFPSAKIRADILLNNPILSDVQVERKYPNTLVIKPSVRSNAALLITPARRVFIDESGIVLSDADGDYGGLTQITTKAVGIRLGQKIIDEDILHVLDFLNGIRSIMPIETVGIDENGVSDARTGTLDIIFTRDTDIRAALATLQTAWAGFRIKGTLPKIIDLRFDKPVVTF